MEKKKTYWVVRYHFANSKVIHDTIQIGNLEDAISHAKYLRQNGETVLGVLRIDHNVTNELVNLD